MSAKFKKFIVTAMVMIAVAFAYVYAAPQNDVNSASYGGADERNVILSDNRAEHILYGDHKGGGHKFGIGAPCKSEFPREWNDARIIDTTKRIAANDNLEWRKSPRNGYYTAESTQDGVRVRVVLGQDKRRIITAYPTNMPRNPCPANDNRYNN